MYSEWVVWGWGWWNDLFVCLFIYLLFSCCFVCMIVCFCLLFVAVVLSRLRFYFFIFFGGIFSGFSFIII